MHYLTLTQRLKKKLDGNYTRMLRAILNKSWRQLPTRHQLYGHLPPFMKTIQVRRTRHAGHCWRSRDELISDVLLWTPTYGLAKAGWPKAGVHHLWARPRTCSILLATFLCIYIYIGVSIRSKTTGSVWIYVYMYFSIFHYLLCIFWGVHCATVITVGKGIGDSNINAVFVSHSEKAWTELFSAQLQVWILP